jgi:hypothetical protein
MYYGKSMAPLTLCVSAPQVPPMRLFHFSEDGGIARFVPRPVLVPSVRPPGMDWLNGPLVWAIEDRRQVMYLFPRDCPRIVVWQTPETAPSDLGLWNGNRSGPVIGFVESAWLERISAVSLYRYSLPPETFSSLADAGMWVSGSEVVPRYAEPVGSLRSAHAALGLELRPMPSLVPLRPLWSRGFHVSGIRLRHAVGWPS